MAKRIEWMCTHCGQKITKFDTGGRPDPGICPKRPKYKTGQSKPHVWGKGKVY